MTVGIALLRPDGEGTAPPVTGSAVSGSPTIAVLPFANASEDPDQEYFSIGLTEDIITELSRYRELGVIAHYATADFKRDHGDADLGFRQCAIFLIYWEFGLLAGQPIMLAKVARKRQSSST